MHKKKKRGLLKNCWREKETKKKGAQGGRRRIGVFLRRETVSRGIPRECEEMEQVGKRNPRTPKIRKKESLKGGMVKKNKKHCSSTQCKINKKNCPPIIRARRPPGRTGKKRRRR